TFERLTKLAIALVATAHPRINQTSSTQFMSCNYGGQCFGQIPLLAIPLIGTAHPTINHSYLLLACLLPVPCSLFPSNRNAIAIKKNRSSSG
ncbi:hypothetical protein, partial [Moorena sp. SIO3I8]|uniref:hypothetical protein n=1 Tax=Moorena sp. SIO3I8 TaxID=2607833 RepID=UPI0025F34C96